jgi:lathosterol oxidase
MMYWSFLLPGLALFAILIFWVSLKKRPKNLESFLITEHSYIHPFTKKELTRTLTSLVIFTAVGLFLDVTYIKGFTKIYTSPSTYSTSYLVVSFFLALAINDVYFYFSHRLMHWKPFFKVVHFMHHQSHTPNPWSAFSFHPIEAVIQIAIVPLIAFCIPIHLYVLIGFGSFMLVVSVYGHCGYELRANKPGVFNVFNNSIHHNQHHQFVKYNFGLYLNIWDRLFKTNHPTYTKVTNTFKQKGGKSK